MAASLSDLLEDIERLYEDLLAQTAESENLEANIDRLTVIEETRQETLQKANLIYEEISQLISVESPREDPKTVGDFLAQKRRLIQLANQIHAMDSKKEVLLKKEQSEISQLLGHLRVGQRATNQYQKNMP
ncbi:MAG: hypothetical protein AAB300_03360 [Nitrospirota bacterium]